MKTPIQTRAVALLAAVLMTFATVQTVAHHAHPQAESVAVVAVESSPAASAVVALAVK